MQIIAIATHGILSGNAIDTVNNSCLSQLIVTNTVPLGDKLERCPKMKVIDVSGTLAEAIRRYVVQFSYTGWKTANKELQNSQRRVRIVPVHPRPRLGLRYPTMGLDGGCLGQLRRRRLRISVSRQYDCLA